MRLAFSDIDLVDKHRTQLAADAGLAPVDVPPPVRSGVPVLLDDSFRPIEPWCTYLRLLAGAVSRTTIRDYGYDAKVFAEFLEQRGVDVATATQDDLVAYREHRMKAAIRPVSPSTWHRNMVVVRGIFSFMTQTGLRDSQPWIQVGRRTVLDVPIYQEMDVRALTQEQWFAFRDIGLGGETPLGVVDRGWRGTHPVRNSTAAGIALATGMRLAEWRTLLNCELPSAETAPDGAALVLRACAKGGKLRRVFVPGEALQAVDLYRRTERRRIVRATRKALAQRRHTLAVVHSIDEGTGKITFDLAGHQKVMQIAEIPADVRRTLVVETEGGLESASLFIGRTGLPPKQRSWLAAFELANTRIASFGSNVPAMPRAITPHDLRHTFAVVLLRQLMSLASQRERDRSHIGAGTLTEHMAVNPLLTVQRLLGHSSPATTMVYLRHVEDTDALVQELFESWLADDRDYAEHLLAQRIRVTDGD